jgi:ferredoxin-NADP reductase
MYQTVLYALSVVVICAIGLSATHVLPQSTSAIIADGLVLCAVSYIVNKLCAVAVDASPNRESWLITALILILIVPPAALTIHHLFLVALFALIAMASKYVLVYHRHHLFNPAAIAAVILGLSNLLPATWWVGSPALFIPTLVCGLLILRKIRRFQLFGCFAIVTLITAIVVGLGQHEMIGSILHTSLLSSPLIFFGTVMLTEPETLPALAWQQRVFGVIAGLLFSSQLHIGSVSATPELSLIIANLYSIIATPKRTILLKLQSIKELIPQTFELTFATDTPLQFEPGQYATINVRHGHQDQRGTRRTFSIASAPGKQELVVALKTPRDARVSSFKQALLKLKPGTLLSVSSISGTFVVPKSATEKLVFLAGGIGITPFLSMIRGQVNNKTKRDITVLYFVGNKSELCFEQVWNEARTYGVKMVPVFAAPDPTQPNGLHGHLVAEDIKKVIPDFAQRTFYISGPPGFVDGYKNVIGQAGVSLLRIHTDHFAGY